MKIAAVILIVALLCGCSSGDDQLDQALDLRKRIQEAQTCSFETTITADYEDVIYTFQMSCSADNSGNLRFTVIDPDTIAGITGTISADSASLSFDDKVLAFPMLADGQVTPVSAPWLFFYTLCSGYLTGCSREEEGLCIYIDDSFEENPLHLMIYTDQDTVPVFAEIIWKDRRILSLDIRDFTIQ